MTRNTHRGGSLRRRLAAGLVLLVTASGLSVVSTQTPALAASTESIAIGIYDYDESDKRVLQVTGTANGASVAAVTYQVGASGANIDNQRWILELDVIVDIDITPVYTIRNVQTGKCLTRASSNVNNAAVTIQPCADTIPQMWTVPYFGASQGVQIISMSDYRCLDLAGGSATSGALVRVSNCNGGWYQQWKQRYGSYNCDRYSNQRFLTGLCVNTGVPPMYGLFGTFRNQPISFGADAATLPNTLVNFIELRSLNAQLANSAVDGVEFGLHASYNAETGQQEYFPYWVEWGQETEEYHGISGTPNGGDADGRLHHYLILANNDQTEWDVLYDYNVVGTTRLQEGARFRSAYAITSVVYPNVVTTAEPFENRLQLWDANGVWRRPYLSETSRSEPKTCHALPTDEDGLWNEFNLPPWCMTTELGTVAGASGTEVQYLRVGKPNSVFIARAAPEAGSGSTAAVVNGVDQSELRACLNAQTDPCLDTVLGLRECVAARKVCNTTTAMTPSPRRSTTLTSQHARNVAKRLLTTKTAQPNITDSRVDTTTVGKLNEQLRTRITTPAVTDATPVKTVTGRGTVPGLSNHDRAYQSYTLVLDATSGSLVYACLGRQCPVNDGQESR
ncbi:RICIN domain-containing protein [Salinispora tropica]|uniref:RICIN domain-containing protein n=1 Tax=Salinispora tropica TaxID=168695 RepID=UPI0009B892CE|nr:RICIN domain-containing protein [Salinispora tropica]